MELVRRITITERPGYEPDGDGFVRRVSPHEALFGFALAVNKRQQERKAMNDTGDTSSPDRIEWQKQNMDAFVGKQSWAPPETLSAKLSRFLFQIQNTETSLAELRREVEKLRSAL